MIQTPIIFHANGGSRDGEYSQRFQDLLRDPSLRGKYKLPKNVRILTWNNYAGKKDLDLSLEYLGYDPAVSMSRKDSEWVEKVKFRAKDDQERWINLNKIIYLKDYVDNADWTGIDYVFILDYTDVLVAGDLAEAIRRFESFNCQALFNTEVNCFSTKEFKPFHDRVAREKNLPKVYLNSGCCLVRASYIKTLVNAAYENIQNPKSIDDQIVYHQVYAENYPAVEIDREEKIFKCLHNNEPNSQKRYLQWYTANELKLGIGLPMLFPYIHYKFVNSFMMLKKPQRSLTLSNVGSLTALARNNIVDIAKKQECTHLLFLDTDMTFPPDTIERLLSHQKDIVSGIYFERYAPYRPVLRQRFQDGYTIPNYPPSGLIKVDATGGGCLLINMEVFDYLQKPYFDYRLEKSGIKETFFSEDLVWCERVRTAGFDIWCDTSIRCGHLINDYEITEANWDGTTEFR